MVSSAVNACARLAFATGILLLAVVAPGRHALKASFHPTCLYSNVAEGFFDYVEDITALLHGALPPSVCVFNPTILHYQNDLYIWSARAYTAYKPRLGCLANPATPRPPVSFDNGKGTHTFLLAVTRTKWNGRGNITHEMLGHVQYDFQLEDPRLFKDPKGAMWLLLHNPRGAMITVAPVTINCTLGAAKKLECAPILGAVRILLYLNSMQREKNWVPHNGTTRTTYPIYPTFSPHSVFDWGSFENPAVKRTFDFVAPPEPFFDLMNSTYKAMIEFAGSTPSILHDDGVSYISVGHIRAHPFCFHDALGGTISATCAEFATRQERQNAYHFAYWHGEGHSYFHHVVEYAMFFYKFSASPPYIITHLSHAFVPCTYFDSGIVYPAGLDRIGPDRDYILSYGEADRFCRVATFKASKLDEMLMPIETMRGTVNEFSLCTLPCV